MNVFARWRPLTASEATSGEISRTTTTADSQNQLLSVFIARSASDEEVALQWKSSHAFHSVLETDDDNADAYNFIVAPAIPLVLDGGNSSFFAYGHSGSGKTHSLIGYNFEDDKQLGLCLAASKKLFSALKSLNDSSPEISPLGIGFSLFELRKKTAYDLLNNRTECHIREGYDGKTNIRGKTETLEGGKVRVQPIVQQSVWDYDSLRRKLIEALGHRAVGSSSIHDQSSRTHAVLELEIVNKELIDARQAVIERQSELVPVGKHATDVYLDESMKSIVTKEGGGFELNPNYQKNQARIDAAEAEKTQHEERVSAAERNVNTIIASSKQRCLGAKIIFVDLAGAEYQTGGKDMSDKRQTPQDRQEGRQINTDLLALKEVMRAWSKNQARIPFRSSALTMVLREHFRNSSKKSSSMIVTLSPAKSQYKATLDSLKYASLVGVATAG